MDKNSILKKRKRKRLFPWLTAFFSKYAKKFLDDDEVEALEYLLANLDDEVKALLMEPDEKKAEELFNISNTMLLHLSWKIQWKSVQQWKSYWKKVESPPINTSNVQKKSCTKFLYCLLYLSLLLTDGNKESEWINRILTIFKIIPNLLDEAYSALLLVVVVKKKYTPIYHLILKNVLLKSTIKNEVNCLFYSKVILLFRRLLKLTHNEVERNQILSIALKQKPPANFISWLSSINDNNSENLRIENVMDELLSRTYPDDLLRKLQEILRQEEGSHQKAYDFNNIDHLNDEKLSCFSYQESKSTFPENFDLNRTKESEVKEKTNKCEVILNSEKISSLKKIKKRKKEKDNEMKKKRKNSKAEKKKRHETDLNCENEDFVTKAEKEHLKIYSKDKIIKKDKLISNDDLDVSHTDCLPSNNEKENSKNISEVRVQKHSKEEECFKDSIHNAFEIPLSECERKEISRHKKKKKKKASENEGKKLSKTKKHKCPQVINNDSVDKIFTNDTIISNTISESCQEACDFNNAAHLNNEGSSCSNYQDISENFSLSGVKESQEKKKINSGSILGSIKTVSSKKNKKKKKVKDTERKEIRKNKKAKKKKHHKTNFNCENGNLVAETEKERLKNYSNDETVKKDDIISNDSLELNVSQSDNLLLNNEHENCVYILETKVQNNEKEKECFKNVDNNALELCLSECKRKEKNKHKKKKKASKDEDKELSKSIKREHHKVTDNDADDQTLANDTENSDNILKIKVQNNKKERESLKIVDNNALELCLSECERKEKSKHKKKKKATKDEDKELSKTKKCKYPKVTENDADDQTLANDTIISNSDLEMCFSQIDRRVISNYTKKNDIAEENSEETLKNSSKDDNVVQEIKCSKVIKEHKKSKKLKSAKKYKKEYINTKKEKEKFKNSETQLLDTDLHHLDVNNLYEIGNNILTIKTTAQQGNKLDTTNVDDGIEIHSLKDDTKNKKKCKMKKLFNIESNNFKGKDCILPHSLDEEILKNQKNESVALIKLKSNKEIEDSGSLNNSSSKSSETNFENTSICSDVSISELLKFSKINVSRNNKALGIKEPIKNKTAYVKTSPVKNHKKRKIDPNSNTQSSEETGGSLFSNNELIVASKNILVQTQASENYSSQSLFEEDKNCVDFDDFNKQSDEAQLRSGVPFEQTHNSEQAFNHNSSCNVEVTNCFESDSLTIANHQSNESLMFSSVFKIHNSSTSSVFSLSSSNAVSPSSPLQCNETLNSVPNVVKTENTQNYCPGENKKDLLSKPKLFVPYVVLNDIKKSFSESSSSIFDVESSISSQVFNDNESSCSTANSVFSLCRSQLTSNDDVAENKKNLISKPKHCMPYVVLEDAKKSFSKSSSSTFDVQSSISSQAFNDNESSCSTANSMVSLYRSQLTSNVELDKTKKSPSMSRNHPLISPCAKTILDKILTSLPSSTENENREIVPCLIQNVTKSDNEYENENNSLTCFENSQENNIFTTEDTFIPTSKTIISNVDSEDFLMPPTLKHFNEDSFSSNTILYQSDQNTLFTEGETDAKTLIYNNINKKYQSEMNGDIYLKNMGTNTDSIDSSNCLIEYKINNNNNSNYTPPLSSISSLQIIINLNNKSDHQLLNTNQLITNINFHSSPSSYESSIVANTILNEENATLVASGGSNALLDIPSNNNVPVSQNSYFNEASQTVQLTDLNNDYFSPSISCSERSQICSNSDTLLPKTDKTKTSPTLTKGSEQGPKFSTPLFSNPENLANLNRLNLNNSLSFPSNIYEDLKIINSPTNACNNNDITSNIKPSSTESSTILQTKNSFTQIQDHDSSSFRTGTDIYSDLSSDDLSVSTLSLISDIEAELSVGENILISSEAKDNSRRKRQISKSKKQTKCTLSSNKSSQINNLKKAFPRKRAKSGVSKRKKVKSSLCSYQNMNLQNNEIITISNTETNESHTDVVPTRNNSRYNLRTRNSLIRPYKYEDCEL